MDSLVFACLLPAFWPCTQFTPLLYQQLRCRICPNWLCRVLPSMGRPTSGPLAPGLDQPVDYGNATNRTRPADFVIDASDEEGCEPG